MSRIGKMPVLLPAGVKASVDGRLVTVEGPKGKDSFEMPVKCRAVLEKAQIRVEPLDTDKRTRAMWGMARAMIQNLVTGLDKGYGKRLEIRGVGYRAQMKGAKLSMALGFSHEVLYEPPAGVTLRVPENTVIEVTGNNKQKVGQVAATIRSFRPPEPYKGKGVRYAGEYVFMKEGKRK